MRVTSLRVSNLFSFATFAIDEVRDGLTVIVGPNGSGKSNLVRALDAMVKLIEWADDQTRHLGTPPFMPAGSVVGSYVQAAHDGSPPGTPIDLRVGIELTTASERERIVALMRAALLATLCQQSANPNDEALKAGLAAWVLEEVQEAKLESLLAGTLVFHHPGHETALWDVRYEFRHQEQVYEWILYSFASRDSIVPQATSGELAPSSTELCQALFNQPYLPTPLPDQLPPFELGRLCLPPGQRLGRLHLAVGTGVFTDQYQPFRDAARILKLPDVQGQISYGLARPLRLCVDEGMVLLGEQFRGLGVGGTPPWRAGVFPWEMLTAPTAPRDPSLLPLRLFGLKNGPTVEEREAFTAVQRQFERLAQGRSCDVTFTSLALPVSTSLALSAGQVTVPAGGGDETRPGALISVVAWRKRPEGQPRHERPIQLQGAGAWEALVLAEALATSAQRLTVLDEPAINFHPGWQTALRHALLEAPGQMLLVTHSTGLIPMETEDDVRRLVLISNESGASRLHVLPEGVITKAAARITRSFASSADARALLLSRGAVVFSWATELSSFPIWWAKSPASAMLGMPADLDLAFYSVEGDGGFANVLTLLHELGIPWVLICDGQSFDVETNWSSHVFRQIINSGIDIPKVAGFLARVQGGDGTQRTMTQDLWDEEIALGAEHGILTLATSWRGNGEAIEALFEWVLPEEWAEARTRFKDRRSKVRRARWLAHETACPDELDNLYRRVLAALER